VRRSSLVLALLLTACTKDNPEKPGKDAAQADKAPTAAEPELDTDGEPTGLETRGKPPAKQDEHEANEAERVQCVATCVEANVAVAKPADVIEADCQAKCQSPPVQ
jgi:hypothetical protein